MCDQSSFVYLIWQVGTNHFKIGYSKNPKTRLSELQIGSPHQLELLTVMPTDNPEGDEARLHRKYSDNYVRGEWFEIGDWGALLEDFGLNSSMVKFLITQLNKTNVQHGHQVRQIFKRVVDCQCKAFKLLGRIESSAIYQELMQESNELVSPGNEP